MPIIIRRSVDELGSVLPAQSGGIAGTGCFDPEPIVYLSEPNDPDDFRISNDADGGRICMEIARQFNHVVWLQPFDHFLDSLSRIRIANGLRHIRGGRDYCVRFALELRGDPVILRVNQLEVVPDRLLASSVLAERIARDLPLAGRRAYDLLVSAGTQVEWEAVDAHLVSRTVLDVEVDSVWLNLDDRRPQARPTVLRANDLDERCCDRLPVSGLRPGGGLGAAREHQQRHR